MFLRKETKLKTISSVRVKAPSRIHCGLLNESASNGFVDGGFGFSLCSPYWDIEMHKENKARHILQLSKEHNETLTYALTTLSKHLGRLEVSITVRNVIPSHVGLGSKTSLLLVVARAFCELMGVKQDILHLAKLLGRGGTSGIGIYSVLMGGYIRDAGHKFPEEKQFFGPSSMKLSSPPRLLIQTPVNWLRVIHFRFADVGVYGDAERSMFQMFCPVPERETEIALSLTNQFVDRGIREQDENAIQIGISRFQDVGFKAVEWKHQAPITKEFRKFWEKKGFPYAVGLTSMGPTLYCLSTEPEKVVECIRRFDAELLHCVVTNISNTGMLVDKS